MEKRNIQVNVRFTRDQFEKLAALATVNGMKPTEYLRWLLRLQTLAPTVENKA